MAKEREITQGLISVIVKSTQDEDEGIVEIIGGISKFYPNVFDMYDVISVYIYGLGEEDFVALKDFFKEEPDINERSFQKLVKDLSNSEYKDLAEQGSPLRKFERHIKLACAQKDFIQKNIQEANRLADETLMIANTAMDSFVKVNETIASSEKSAKYAKEVSDTASVLADTASKIADEASESSKKTVKDLDEMKTKIYSEFIGILGIFTAVAFMVMGSLELLNNLFSDISNPTSRVIGYVLVAGGIYLLVLYLLMVSLFVGMKKVTGNGSSYDVNDRMFKVIVSIALILVFIGVLFSGGIVH